MAQGSAGYTILSNIVKGTSGSANPFIQTDGNGNLYQIPVGTTSDIGTNSTVTPLTSGSTFTGTGELVYAPDVMVSCQTDKAGILYFDFSNDGTNWSTFPTNGFNVVANIHEFHTAVKGPRYFRVRLTDTSGEAQSYLRLYTHYGTFRQGNAPLNQSIGGDSDALITKGVIVGVTDGGQYKNIPVTSEGHLEVEVHGPRLPFGSIHTEQLTPVFQTDGVYGVNLGQINPFSGSSGTVTTENSSLKVSTGVSAFGYATLQSRKRLRYRPGQGLIGRFAGKFTSPVADSYQLIGFGHGEDGLYIGYSGSSFGILHNKRGVRQQMHLPITTPSTTAETIDVILNSVSQSVAVTNNNNVYRTAYEIAQGNYTGWDAYSSGSTVIFLASSAGPYTGNFNINATTAVGSFSYARTGSAVTQSFVSQSEWEEDTLNGSGPSGITLDPTKGNVYQFGVQYLGYGAQTIQIEVAQAGNNPTFQLVHSLNYPNSLDDTVFGNPSFPFTMAAYSYGSTTNLDVKVGSYAGFIEGKKILYGNRAAYFQTVTDAGAANYRALFTVKNPLVYNGRANQSVINILDVSGAVKHTQPASLYLIKNGTLTGNINYKRSSNTTAGMWFSGSSNVSFQNLDQIYWVGELSETGRLSNKFDQEEEITIQPGEWITLAAKTSTGTAAYTAGSINTREDQ